MGLAATIQFWGSGWGSIPTNDITTGPSAVRISRVVNKDVTTFSFTPSNDYQAYKIKSVPATDSPHTAGNLIEAGSGGIGGSQRAVDVTDDEVVDAGLSEGNLIIKVFIQNYAGIWSTN